MVNIAKGVFGGVMLFLGRDMEWLFALGLGLLVGFKVSSLLAADSPIWMAWLLVAAIGAISILPFLVYPESNYIVTGFLAGGYVLSEYGGIVTSAFLGFEFSGSTWLVFFVGAVIGAVILGLTQSWGIIFATALAGAFLVTGLMNNPSPIVESLVAGGLFIAGCLVQAIIMRIEKGSER